MSAKTADDPRRVSQPAPAQPSPLSSNYAALIFALLLALGTLVLYNPALQADFVTYDDPTYVFMNKHVLQGLTWAGIKWAFTTTMFANWHPLTWLSHMAAAEFFGTNAMGHHLINVFLHTLNVALLFLVLRKATGYTGRSALVAALFAVHPLNVESVAWVSERKGLLCIFFVLLTLWAYTRYARQPALRRYLWVVFFFALALMAKPMAITLPFLLLLFDFWPLERFSIPGAPLAQTGRELPAVSLGRLLSEKLVLVLIAAASTIITFIAQRGGGTIAAIGVLPFRFRLGNAVQSYFLYIFKGIWPARLAVFYPHPERSLEWSKVALAGVVLLIITAAVWHWRRKRYLLTGWLWFAVALAPVAGFVQIGRQAMSDRYAYLPLLGIFMMTVWLVADLTANAPALQRGAAIVSVIAVCGFAWTTHRQIGYWHDTAALFSHSLEITPPNYVAETNLALALDLTGHPDQALPHALAALRMGPEVSGLHTQYADVLQHLERFDDAVREYQIALTLSRYPSFDAPLHSNLGLALLRANRTAEALEEFNASLRLDPTTGNSYFGRGTIEYRAGQLDAAAQDFAACLQLEPTPLAFFWLGRTLEDKGDIAQAAAAYQKALKMAPGMTEARSRLDALQTRFTR